MPPKKTSTNTVIAWLDTHLLAILAGILLVFIPLYPKIPLFDILPGYIVRVRIEDMLIAITFLVWVVQLYRKKVSLHPLLTKLFVIYAIIGLLSTLSAIFITQSVPTDPSLFGSIHVQKLFLHYFRRLEYFSLFFILYSAATSVKHIKTYLFLLVSVVIAVSAYGYGQKYLYWPVYSTMNREFAKGWKLYLTEHARVPSTFGGHYDAAAFIMIALMVVLAFFFFAKEKWIKAVSALSFLMGFWLLILTSSRTSFVGYLAGLTLFMFLALFIKGFKWVVPRYTVVMAFSLIVMMSFGDLAERYAQFLGLDRFKDKFAHVLFTQKATKPADFEEVTEASKVSVPSDRPPSPEKPGSDGSLPPDVHEKIPIPIAEVDEDGNFTGRTIEVSRTYSDNAYKYGLSAAIRFDALWPRAIAGFMGQSAVRVRLFHPYQRGGRSVYRSRIYRQ
jgi:hypothetical protein